MSAAVALLALWIGGNAALFVTLGPSASLRLYRATLNNFRRAILTHPHLHPPQGPHHENS
jgi:hypothetical protein